LQYATTMGSMLQNIGKLTEKEAAKQSEQLIKLAGDLTAMYGGRVEDAVRALTGSLKGNNTMLDNYGMAVNDAMIKTKALEMGLISGNEQLTLQSKQAATLALIMEQTADAQGQAAREAEGASGQWRAFTTEIQNLAITLGNVLLPVVTPVVAKIRSVIEFIGKAPEPVQKLIVAMAAVAAAIGPLLLAFGALVPAIQAVGAALLFLSANPIVLVIAAIAALIAGIVLLVQNWDWVKEKAIAAVTMISEYIQEHFPLLYEFFVVWFDLLKTLFMTAWDALKAVVTGAMTAIKTIASGAMAIMKAMFGNDLGAVKGIFSTVWAAIQAVMQGAMAAIIGIIEGINAAINTVADVVRTAKEAFIDFANGLKSFVEPILNRISQLVLGVANAVQTLITKLKNLGKAGRSSSVGGAMGGPKAAGGFVQRGTTYPVGERGVEMFTPNRSGYVVPNSKIGGGTNIYVSVNGDVTGQEIIEKVGRGLIEEFKLTNQIGG